MVWAHSESSWMMSRSPWMRSSLPLAATTQLNCGEYHLMSSTGRVADREIQTGMLRGVGLCVRGSPSNADLEHALQIRGFRSLQPMFMKQKDLISCFLCGLGNGSSQCTSQTSTERMVGMRSRSQRLSRDSQRVLVIYQPLFQNVNRLTIALEGTCLRAGDPATQLADYGMGSLIPQLGHGMGARRGCKRLASPRVQKVSAAMLYYNGCHWRRMQLQLSKGENYQYAELQEAAHRRLFDYGYSAEAINFLDKKNCLVDPNKVYAIEELEGWKIVNKQYLQPGQQMEQNLPPAPQKDMERLPREDPGLKKEAERCKDTYQVFVRTPMGRNVVMDVNGNFTTHDFKCMLEQRLGIAAEDQRLLLGGRQLHDADTLQQGGLSGGTQLHIGLRLPGGRVPRTTGDPPPITKERVAAIRKAVKSTLKANQIRLLLRGDANYNHRSKKVEHDGERLRSVTLETAKRYHFSVDAPDGVPAPPTICTGVSAKEKWRSPTRAEGWRTSGKSSAARLSWPGMTSIGTLSRCSPSSSMLQGFTWNLT